MSGAEILFQSLSLVDEQFIEEAEFGLTKVGGRRKLTIGLLIAAAALLLLLGVADYNYSSALDGAEETVRGVLQVEMELSNYLSETGFREDLTEAEIQENIEAYQALLDRYYTTDNPCYDSYARQHKAMAREQTEYTAEYGMENLEITRFQYQQNKVQIEYTAVIWAIFVQEEDGEFFLQAISNELTRGMTLVRKDGVWKFQGNTDWDGLGSDALLDSDYTEMWSSNWKSVTEKRYNSFQDALAAAQEIVQ